MEIMKKKSNPMMRKVTEAQEHEKEKVRERERENERDKDKEDLERPLSNIDTETFFKSVNNSSSSIVKFAPNEETFDVSRHLSIIEDYFSSNGIKFEQSMMLDQIAEHLDNITPKVF